MYIWYFIMTNKCVQKTFKIIKLIKLCADYYLITERQSREMWLEAAHSMFKNYSDIVQVCHLQTGLVCCDFKINSYTFISQWRLVSHQICKNCAKYQRRHSLLSQPRIIAKIICLFIVDLLGFSASGSETHGNGQEINCWIQIFCQLESLHKP